jgi:hypothetical protein
MQPLSTLLAPRREHEQQRKNQEESLMQLATHAHVYPMGNIYTQTWACRNERGTKHQKQLKIACSCTENLSPRAVLEMRCDDAGRLLSVT